ncbi:plasmid recombination protein [Sphaerotilus sp.]|uniref:plasmid recombination protein n=1 Tax=Sphaerotilus sp. TaxID=2093942 RepID=UPI0034E2757D
MSADTDKATNTDEWGAGLRFAGKALNVKTVRRAAGFADVLPVCLAHNLREGNEAHRHRSPIDPTRTGLNEVLRGSARLSVAVELVRNILDELGIVPSRADAIAGIEMVFQPPDGHDTPAFWAECLRWADGRYQHVLSAVVHRDQRRPHLHVIALAVVGGKLAGHAITAGAGRFTIQRREFMAHVFAALGLRPNRRAADPLKALALTAGKGARTATGAARRDAELTRKAGAEWKRPGVCMAVGAIDVHGGLSLETGNRHAHEKARPPYCAVLPLTEANPQNSTQTPVFRQPSATPMTPRLWSLQAGKTSRRSAPKTADNWRQRRPPAVLTPTLSGWC